MAPTPLTDESMKAFLKTYAEILGERFDISGELPLRMNIRMAKGCIDIATNKNVVIACVFDGGFGPAAPIGPIAMTFAEIFIKLTNAYHVSEKKESKDGTDTRTERETP